MELFALALLLFLLSSSLLLRSSEAHPVAAHLSLKAAPLPRLGDATDYNITAAEEQVEDRSPWQHGVAENEQPCP